MHLLGNVSAYSVYNAVEINIRHLCKFMDSERPLESKAIKGRMRLYENNFYG